MSNSGTQYEIDDQIAWETAAAVVRASGYEQVNTPNGLYQAEFRRGDDVVVLTRDLGDSGFDWQPQSKF